MPFHRCAIVREDGTVVAENVDVALQLPEDKGATEWYGTMTVQHVMELTAGQRYRIMLDDGRSGEFFVRRNTFAGGTNRAVAIHGMGPLK